jgi:hypothetical protein
MPITHVSSDCGGVLTDNPISAKKNPTRMVSNLIDLSVMTSDSEMISSNLALAWSNMNL